MMTTSSLFVLLSFTEKNAPPENTATSATSLLQKDLQHACFISEEGVLALTVLTAMRMLTLTRLYAPILLTLAIVIKD